MCEDCYYWEKTTGEFEAEGLGRCAHLSVGHTSTKSDFVCKHFYNEEENRISNKDW